MDLNKTPEQELLSDEARQLLAGLCPPEVILELERSDTGILDGVWDAVVERGWQRLALPAAAGGADDGLLELTILAEEFGRVGLATPLLGSVATVALPLAWAEPGPAVDRWLPRLVDGSAIGTLAVLDGAAANEWSPPELTGKSSDDGWVISGEKTLVPFAAVADVLLVTVDLESVGPAIVALAGDVSGLSLTKLYTIGAEPRYLATLSAVAVSRDDIVASGPDAIALLGRALDAATIVSIGYAVGLGEGALDLVVERAKSREQFGRPIGSYQAVGFRCSEMRADLDPTRLLAYQAAWLTDAGRPSTLETAGAKAYANEAIRRTFTSAHQIMGARGFSFESDLHLFTMRAKAFEMSLGATGLHYERIAVGLGL